MDQKEMLHIQKIMRWVMLITVALYALLLLCVFTIFNTVFSQNAKIIIIIAAPMVIAGLALLIIKKIKGTE